MYSHQTSLDMGYTVVELASFPGSLPSFFTTCEKKLGREPGNEAIVEHGGRQYGTHWFGAGKGIRLLR